MLTLCNLPCLVQLGLLLKAHDCASVVRELRNANFIMTEPMHARWMCIALTNNDEKFADEGGAESCSASAPRLAASRCACSTGAWATPTVLGEYRVTGKGYSFGSGHTCYYYYYYYYTQFFGDYLIHSVTYYQNTFTIMEGKMGVNISHGCVRLPIDHAKWIYDNIPYYTKVVTYR